MTELVRDSIENEADLGKRQEINSPDGSNQRLISSGMLYHILINQVVLIRHTSRDSRL